MNRLSVLLAYFILFANVVIALYQHNNHSLIAWFLLLYGFYAADYKFGWWKQK